MDSTSNNNNLPILLYNKNQVKEWRLQNHNKKIGFVPTMGALHQGHLNLVKLAQKTNDLVIVSIFVNPSQFSPTEDLQSYPRDINNDIQKLINLAEAVYLPSVEEIYPSGIPLNIEEQKGAFVEVKGYSHQLEGSIRPHFFRGVATVLTKLFNIIQPNQVIMGQKDAQQCVIVKKLIQDLLFDIELIVAPITREKNGLAMSSRNLYLDQELLNGDALALFNSLNEAKKLYELKEFNREKLLNCVFKVLETYNNIEIDYISLSNPETLEEINKVDKVGAILSGAIRVGKEGKKVRLIDNVLLGTTL